MKDLIETLEEYANGFTNVIAPPEEDVKELLEHIYNQDKEIERLNNIIKEVREYIQERYDGEVLTHTFDKDNVGELLEILEKAGDEISK